MFRGLRVFGAVLFFGLVLIFTIVFLSHRLLVKSLPQTKGVLQLKFLKSQVEVIRDESGVPHIFAANNYDMYAAAGYVAAQDRLWQMDLNRKIANGRLSEIFGPETVAYDKFLRRLGFHRMAEDISKVLSQRSLLALTAYTYGINAFIETHENKLPVEFTLLDYTPERWRIEDSIGIWRLLAWQSSTQKHQDLLLADLLKTVDIGKLRRLFPDLPAQARYTMTQEDFSFLQICKPFFETEQNLNNFLRAGPSLHGLSRVVSGRKTETGKPILVSAMQDEPVMPSPWYQLHLTDGRTNVAGLTVPGLPIFVTGQNDSISWAANRAEADDIDFFIERIDTTNQTCFDGREWQNLNLRKEEILIKGAKPDSVRIFSTENGLLISDLFPYSQNEKQAISLRWTGFSTGDDLTTFFELQETTNWPDFSAVLDSHKVPVLNFLFADTKGNIAHQMAGSIPVRQYSTGELPHNGWERTGKWSGAIPPARLPKALNSGTGFLTTEVSNGGTNYVFSPLVMTGKHTLIADTLADSLSLSFADNQSLLQNIESEYAKKMLPQILQSLQTMPDSLQTDSLKILTDLIKYWDGIESEDSVPASIFHAFLVNASENIFRDELGKSLYSFFIKDSELIFHSVSDLFAGENDPWFDNIQTDTIETKADIIRTSLLQAGEMLRQYRGEQISDWRWGDLHRATFKHPLGSGDLQGFVLNGGTLRGRGSMMTIRRTPYNPENPFETISVNSAIQIADLENRAIFSVLAGGASGQPFSEHFKDQLELWQNGEFHELSMDKKSLENQQVEHLTLSPFNNQ